MKRFDYDGVHNETWKKNYNGIYNYGVRDYAFENDNGVHKLIRVFRF